MHPDKYRSFLEIEKSMRGDEHALITNGSFLKKLELSPPYMNDPYFKEIILPLLKKSRTPSEVLNGMGKKADFSKVYTPVSG
jgi:hypothetical protein